MATKYNLGELELYLGELDLPDEILETRVSDTLELAIKITRQVCALNGAGFLISDFNICNFAVPVNESAAIQMWDTDSYGYGGYFGDYWDGSTMSRVYDVTRKREAIQFCNEALFQFIFTLISLGDRPFSQFDSEYKYDDSQYNGLFRRRLFPDNLWKIFDQVFSGKADPSAHQLLYELCTAQEDLKKNPGKDRSYKVILAKELEIIRLTNEERKKQFEKEVSADADLPQNIPDQPESTEVKQENKEAEYADEENGGLSPILAFLLFFASIALVILGYFCFF